MRAKPTRTAIFYLAITVLMVSCGVGPTPDRSPYTPVPTVTPFPVVLPTPSRTPLPTRQLRENSGWQPRSPIVTRSADGGLIVEWDGMPGGTSPLLVGSNYWIGQVDSRRYHVAAGDYGQERQPYPTTDNPRFIPTNGPPAVYGALLVWEYNETGDIIHEDIYPTPLPVGNLAIVDVQDSQFLLRASTGDSFVFDLNARQYTDTTGELPEGRDWRIGPWFTESAPKNATDISGYRAYATWRYQEGDKSIELTGYVSNVMWGGVAVAVKSLTDGTEDIVPIPGEYQGVVRPVTMNRAGLILLYYGNGYPVAFDVQNRRVLSEKDALSLLNEVAVPFESDEILGIVRASP